MKFEGKVGGFKEMDALLKQLPQRVENKVLQKATLDTMRSIVKYMRGRAPKDIDERSPASKKYGRLSQNVKAKASKRDRKKGQRGAYITTGRAFWGFFYEKGTRHQPARPWFLPAFETVKDLVLKRFADKMREGITKEVEKLRNSGGNKK
jgi:HK97 gp10 family phage protein